MSQSSSASSSQQQHQEEEEEEEKQEQIAPIRLPRNSSLLKRDSTNRRKESSPSTQKQQQQQQQQQRKTKKPKRREQEADQQIIDRFHGSFHAVLSSLLRLVTWPIRYILTILLPHTFAGLTATAILLSLLYLLLISFQRFFASQLLLLPTTIPNPLDLLVQASSLVSTPIVYFYCSTLHAPFFCNHHHHKQEQEQEEEEEEGREQKIAQYARTLSGSAQKASDIFDSVLLLSHPSHLGLHQSEILELAYAIRWSSSLEHRDALAHQLAELADLSRSLKDMLIDLNGQSLNAFSFIAYQFSRLGDLMEWVEQGEKKYTSETIAKNLEILFEHLTSEMDGLLGAIEGMIPVASRSTNLGLRVSEQLHRSHYDLIARKEEQGLWRKLADLASFSGHQLTRDLRLTSESIANLKLTWTHLEQLRSDLLAYRNNVAHFKASFTGAHLADHQLEPQDELFSMRQVIRGFQATLAQVKSTSRVSHPPPPSSVNRLLPSEQPHQPS